MNRHSVALAIEHLERALEHIGAEAASESEQSQPSRLFREMKQRLNADIEALHVAIEASRAAERQRA